MVIFHVTYDCPSAADRGGFLKALKENRIEELCQNEAGNLMYRYMIPADSETELFLVEKWETIEDQKLHTTQTHFKLIGELKRQFGVESRVEWFEGK